MCTMFNSWLKTASMVNWKKLALRFSYCPVCAARRPMIRIDENDISVRCLVCRASAITMSLVAVLGCMIPNIENKVVYELSSRGALFRYLNRHAGELCFSEFYESVSPGAFYQGIQCQDVQKLTYTSNSFDVCTSTEVFEHVPDDLKGFSEIRRVLKPGGIFIFTVPLGSHAQTIERAIITESGSIQHILEPEFHGDPIRGHRPVLSFRNYGRDIVNRLTSQGFAHAELVDPGEVIPWGYKRFVVVAYRDAVMKNNAAP